jgi:hypothetical protein
LANLFANHLLVPTRWLATEATATGYDVLKLKSRFRTASHEVVAWRLLDLPEPCVITIVDNDRVSRRRSNAWSIRRALSASEQKCQRYVHERSEATTIREDGWTVQGWPVHELVWKREILRSIHEDAGFTA